jgi:hypothetical protein
LEQVVLVVQHLVNLHHRLEFKEVQVLLGQYQQLVEVVVVMVFLQVDQEVLPVVLVMVLVVV